MRLWRYALWIPCFLLLATAALAQQPDGDGDGVPDSGDYCWQTPGTAALHGCNADNFPDLDHDGVGDPDDTCIDQAGLAENSGCPAGVTPDRDLDGVPDQADNCPREPGAADHQGCPPDADGDGIPDQFDACAQQAGDGGNLGCPAGVAPPDGDGDGAPDLNDACPQHAGSDELGGCPDGDGDAVPDTYDACPDQPGQSDLFGCAPVTETTLPTSLAPISAGNAAQIAEVGRLVVGSPRFALAAVSNWLVVRASDDLLAYDLGGASLRPLLTVNTGWSGYPVAASADGRYFATLEFPPDFSTPAFAHIRDGATGAPLYPILAEPDSAGNALNISAFAFDPALPLLAVAETSAAGFTNGVGTPVVLWDAANNRSAGQLAHPTVVINLAFSGDGAKLATDSLEGGSMILSLWDVGSQTRITAFPTTPILHFMGTPMALNRDGSRAAVGSPDGSLSLWQIDGGNAAQQYSVPVFDRDAGEVVSALAFSPDGSVIAAAGGGVPVLAYGKPSGGLTGQELFPVVLIDAATGATLLRLDGHDSLIRDLAFSPNGQLLISAGDSSIKFWGVG